MDHACTMDGEHLPSCSVDVLAVASDVTDTCRADCEEDIKGFSNALYKGFPTAAEAENYLKIHENSSVTAASRPPGSCASLQPLRFCCTRADPTSASAASPKKPNYYAVSQGRNGAQIYNDW